MTVAALLGAAPALSACHGRCAPDEVRAGDGRCYGVVGDAPADTALPAHTDAERGQARVARRAAACDEGGWTYLVDAAPSPGAATIEIADAARAESHPMALADVSHWQLSATLPVAPPGEQQPGVSTAFPCEAQGALTWRVEVWDADGRWADCVVWGAEPARLADARCAAW